MLSGTNGPARKIVVLNAALAILAGGRAGTVREGAAVAEECIDTGAAARKLQALIELSHG